MKNINTIYRAQKKQTVFEKQCIKSDFQNIGSTQDRKITPKNN